MKKFEKLKSGDRLDSKAIREELKEIVPEFAKSDTSPIVDFDAIAEEVIERISISDREKLFSIHNPTFEERISGLENRINYLENLI